MITGVLCVVGMAVKISSGVLIPLLALARYARFLGFFASLQNWADAANLEIFSIFSERRVQVCAKMESKFAKMDLHDIKK